MRPSRSSTRLAVPAFPDSYGPRYAVASLVLAEGDVDIEAAVLVSPVVRMRSVVEAMERRFGVSYAWSDASREIARRIDFVGRAAEIAEHQHDPAVLLVVGEDDDAAGFRQPAVELRDTLTARYADPTRVELMLVPGTEHAVAEEPGVAPAPQTAHAIEVDRAAVAWLHKHLSGA